MSTDDFRMILAIIGFVSGVTSLILYYISWRLRRKLEQQKWQLDYERLKEQLAKDQSDKPVK